MSAGAENHRANPLQLLINQSIIGYNEDGMKTCVWARAVLTWRTRISTHPFLSEAVLAAHMYARSHSTVFVLAEHMHPHTVIRPFLSKSAQVAHTPVFRRRWFSRYACTHAVTHVHMCFSWSRFSGCTRQHKQSHIHLSGGT